MRNFIICMWLLHVFSCVQLSDDSMRVCVRVCVHVCEADRDRGLER